MTDLAARLAEARRTGNALDAPASLSLADGYAIAEAVVGRLGTPVGWKIGATSAGAQAALAVGEPICGRVFVVGASGGTVALPGGRAAEAEPEIVVRLARDPADVSDVAEAIAGLHLGIEIVRPSRDDALALGAGFIVADNAAHVALVVGPALAAGALDDPAALAVELRRNGEPQGTGNAASVLGHPLEALRWLAGARRLRAGDWIATGAMARACPLVSGDEVVADFGAFGSVRVARSPAAASFVEVMPAVGE